MTLEEYQRAVLQLSFKLEADADALPTFQLYRHMIRSRFVGMAELAFKRSRALAGSLFSDSFARYLAGHGASSPILREVIASFAGFALADRALLEAAHPALPDLLRFEAAVWRVAGDDAQLASEPLRELDFDGVLVANPTLTLLALEHEVSEADAELAHSPHALLVYRRVGEGDVHWYRAPALLSELLALSAGSEATLGTHVSSLFARARPHDAEAGQALLEQLASALTVAVERGVLAGVRDPR